MTKDISTIGFHKYDSDFDRVGHSCICSIFNCFTERFWFFLTLYVVCTEQGEDFILELLHCVVFALNDKPVYLLASFLP